jgi:hypothetical protein
MKNKYWYAVCAPDECHAIPVGPFTEREDAEEECNIGCEHAHFTYYGFISPGVIILIRAGLGYVLDEACEHNRQIPIHWPKADVCLETHPLFTEA